MNLPHLYKESPNGDSLYYSWFQAMHTRIDLMLCGQKQETDFQMLSEKTYELILHLEMVGNCFLSQSELSNLNFQAFEKPVLVSEELYDILLSCKKYNQQTFGLFDITTDSDNYNSETIKSITLSDDRMVSFQRPGIRINLSGFLKGYALDRIKKILEEHQIENALINLGNSSILALGQQPGKDCWNVSYAVQSNQPISLNNECLTTSGNHSESRRHIVNPRTGLLVEGKRSVGVVTRSGASGEAFATALFLADEQLKKQLEENPEILRTFEF